MSKTYAFDPTRGAKLMGIWEKITQEQTARGLALILSFLVALGGLYAYFKPSTPAAPHAEQSKAQANSTSQSTSGPNSPIINANTGSITYSAGGSPAAASASADQPGNPPVKK